MLEIIKLYWKPIAIVALAASLVLFGYYKGYQHEKARYDEHLQTDATLVAVAKAENERRLQEQTEITTNVAKEYADAVSKINDYYKSHPHIIRLCNTGTSSSVPTESTSTQGTNAATNGASEAVAEVDMQKAAAEIKQCQLLIEFEQEQDRVK